MTTLLKFYILCVLTTCTTAYDVIDHSCTWKNVNTPYVLESCPLMTNGVAHCQSHVMYTRCKQEVPNYSDDFEIIVNEPRQNDLFNVSMRNIIKLTLSDGELTAIPEDVYRLNRLKAITITGNKISNVNFDRFVPLAKLESISLTRNKLYYIETAKEVNAKSRVKFIDISHNCIEEVPKGFLKRFISLENLSMSHNSIVNIDSFIFGGLEKIKTITISYNKIRELQNSFLNLTKLHVLSINNNNITTLTHYNFDSLVNLKKLNSSYNNIKFIDNEAFKSLVSLSRLDLSYNKIDELNFETKTLRNLTALYMQHNNIRKIKNQTFINLVSLKELDLSFNSLIYIDMLPSNLIQLDISSNLRLKLVGNHFHRSRQLEVVLLNNIQEITFENSSISIKSLEAQSCGISDIDKIQVFNIKNLNRLNLSRNEIVVIDKNSFKTVPLLVSLDLSTNKIMSLNNDAFLHLNKLKNLNLHGNNLTTIDYNVFQGLTQLTNLDLSKNRLNKLDALKTALFYEDSDATTKVLKAQSCGVADKNQTPLQKLDNLNLNRNEINYIDKDSFKDIPSLIYLDLSFNKITSLQTGAFLYLNNLKNINLQGNNLIQVQYGVFERLTALTTLDLSNNQINEFDPIIIKSPIENLYLDDNIIINLNLRHFVNTIRRELLLSVGGNHISCQDLVELIYAPMDVGLKRIVTARELNFYVENVDGIPCRKVVI